MLPTLACPGYVVKTIRFPQFPFVCSKLPRSLVPGTACSFLSAGKLKAETLTLGLAVKFTLLDVEAEATGVMPGTVFPLRGLCCGERASGEPVTGEGETASEGVIERMEVEEGFRWKGTSTPEGSVSSFAFMLRSAACVDIWCISSCIDH
jgi:hypothetical protein